MPLEVVPRSRLSRPSGNNLVMQRVNNLGKVYREALMTSTLSEIPVKQYGKHPVDSPVIIGNTQSEMQRAKSADNPMKTRVRKAVFPVAGMGTRFLPATKAIPEGNAAHRR